MQTTTFGRLGWQVSVAGLGCGGPSRLGTTESADLEAAADVVRAAIDAGVTLIDTARSYGTEPAVGAALASRPAKTVRVATKTGIRDRDGLVPVSAIRTALEISLRELRRDHIDLFQLHAVQVDDYQYVRNEVVPALLAWRDAGLIGGLGITERFERDTSHLMLRQAIADDCWDSVMVGFNLLNPSARTVVLPACRARGIGVLVMFAVRRALSRPERARAALADLQAQGLLDDCGLDADEPFSFLVGPGLAESVPAAAYRFCRHEPGCDVVLTGTGSIEHLHANLAALQDEPLPEALQQRLVHLFGHCDQISGS